MKFNIKKRKLMATATALSLLINNLGVVTLSSVVRADTKKQLKTRTFYKNLVTFNPEYQYNTNYSYEVVDSMEIKGETINIVRDSNDVSEEVVITEEATNEEINEDGIDYPVNIIGEVPLEFLSLEDMISFYSKVFQVDENIISDKINELIELDSDNFYENNTLNGIEYNSEEEAIARTIREIYNNSESYGLTRDEMHVDEYELGDLAPEELIFKFAHVLNVNPYIALSVAYAESGRLLASHNFLTNYNVAGLHPRTGYHRPTTREGYIIYQNMADGLFDFEIILHDYFYVESNDGIGRINSMSRSYSEVPGHWRNLVTSIYYDLTNNGYDSCFNNKNPEREFIYRLVLENEEGTN